MPEHGRELLQVAKDILSQDDSSTAHACRSVSTSYYAIFHHVLGAATDLFIGGNESNLTRAKDHLVRSVEHAQLVKRCGRAHNEKWEFPEDIVKFANAIKQAQIARENADYGVKEFPDKAAAEQLVGQVEDAMDSFDKVDEKHRRAFLVWALVQRRDEDGKLK